MTTTTGDSSSGGAASPLTARSMRLERVAQALAHSQEELRRRSMGLSPNQQMANNSGHMTIPHSGYGLSPLSSRYGSQESLSRHFNTMGSMSMLPPAASGVRVDGSSSVQKKKGIKSSLGRFFSKKEKVKGVKDTLPDGSPSMMSIGNLSMGLSETESNYDAMSMTGGMMPRIASVPGSKISSVDYGRQKKYGRFQTAKLQQWLMDSFVFAGNMIIVTIYWARL